MTTLKEKAGSHRWTPFSKKLPQRQFLVAVRIQSLKLLKRSRRFSLIRSYLLFIISIIIKQYFQTWKFLDKAFSCLANTNFGIYICYNW